MLNGQIVVYPYNGIYHSAKKRMHWFMYNMDKSQNNLCWGGKKAKPKRIYAKKLKVIYSDRK